MPGVTYGQRWYNRSTRSTSDLNTESLTNMAPQKKHDPKNTGTYTNGYDRNSDIYDYYPTYLLEHLATFSVGSQYGIQSPKDGLRRLLQMEKSSGIWTQKMQMRLEKKWVVIIDNENGDIVERFPMNLISDPTSYTSNDPRELYNNVLVFIVKDDPKNKNHNPPEMHIFQCARVSAQEVVSEMKMFISGKWKPGAKQTRTIPPPPTNPPPDPPVNGVNVREQVNLFNAVAAAAASPPRSDGMIQRITSSGYQKMERMDNGSDQNAIYSRDSNDETSSTSSEKYERDVAILNHCFDDIERFIARLQHAAAAFKELERRQKRRKNKKKDLGDGMLSMRAKPPLEREFMDILQKFKLSFNLLAKLKSHIHDPNAPELVHFLFTPLTLIVDAAKDSNYSIVLPSRVVSPLLTKDAIELLMNCCTSKESDMWHSLGDAWIIPREQWKGYENTYHPVFSDGWAPEYPFSEKRERVEVAVAATTASMATKIRKDDLPHSSREEHAEVRQDYRVPSRQEAGSRYGSEFHYSERNERAVSPGGRHSPDMSPQQQPFESRYYTGHNFEMPSRDSFDRNGAITPISDHEYPDHRDMRSDFSADSIDHGNSLDHPHRQMESQQKLWLEDMKSRGARIVQVMYPRTANNDKELTVVRGEYLEVIDDSRKWWKARNAHGQVAHVPHTIVGSVAFDDDGFNNPIYGSRTNGSKDGMYTPSDSPVGQDRSPESVLREPSSQPKPHSVLPNPAPADWIKRERQGKKERQVYEELQADMIITDDVDEVEEKLTKNIARSALPISAAANSSQTLPRVSLMKTDSSPKRKTMLSPPSPSLQDLLQEELKKRVTLGPKSGVKLAAASEQHHKCNITADSNPNDVQIWLDSKKFSSKTRQFLQNMNGRDVFMMTKDKMDKNLGSQEATRLFNQVTVQKNICGFKSTGHCGELSYILEERRKNLDRSPEPDTGKNPPCPERGSMDRRKNLDRPPDPDSGKNPPCPERGSMDRRKNLDRPPDPDTAKNTPCLERGSVDRPNERDDGDLEKALIGQWF